MVTKPQKCSICKKVPEPDCDYRQGRCPHFKPMIDLKSKPRSKTVKQPDPRSHRNISFAKSGLRIVGCMFLISGNLWAAGGLLLVAEVLGVAEEMV